MFRRTQEFPDAVPLMSVTDYAPHIAIDDIHQPIDVHPEMITVHLSHLDRIRRFGGLGCLDIGVGDVPARTSMEGDIPLVSGVVDYDADDYQIGVYQRPDAIVTLDGAGLSLESHGRPNDSSRVRLLNAAVEEGLLAACFAASVDADRARWSAYAYSCIAGLSVVADFSVRTALVISLVNGASGNGAAVLWKKVAGPNPAEQDADQRVSEKPRTSLFAGITPDRYLAARAITKLRGPILSLE